ncbi:ankyrin repeat protein [Polychaeton citri CBS 116435]|uniref:Ankyrin repeat protein n=1 Tax=Polychaeton citri CBS 116435 TaxID=1314669 RepID=A0A9P4Q6W3_9PEZI|nr:ankyrin repeat protein [Polychaeton citri CBS 116435]
MSHQTKLTYDDYTVAWICPLEVEHVAATEMLDEQHEPLPQPQDDDNIYELGCIAGHNVVITGLPIARNSSMPTIVAHMTNTFRKLRFALLVGIGAGVPTSTDEGFIRLGHVVVSEPRVQHSGAIQYDCGKAEAGSFERIGFLAPPPNVLIRAAKQISNVHPLIAHVGRIDTSIRTLRQYRNPGSDNDHLYQSDCAHADKSLSCRKCGCDAAKRVVRDADLSDGEDARYADNDIVVHRGTIAVGGKVIRDGLQRDQLAEKHNILCFETEAAGVLNDLPCLVIRGISDYADSHRSDRWCGYAAAVAAAYARELLFHVPPGKLKYSRVPERGS